MFHRIASITCRFEPSVENLMHAIKTNHLGVEIWDFCTLDRSFEIEPYEGAPFLRVFCARVGTTLIAQWALPSRRVCPKWACVR